MATLLALARAPLAIRRRADRTADRAAASGAAAATAAATNLRADDEHERPAADEARHDAHGEADEWPE